MRPARILLGDLPLMMREIVEGAVGSQHDMELLGHCTDGELVDVARQHHADVVIVAAHEERESDERQIRLLHMNPHLRIVVMASSGRSAALVALRRLDLPEPSPVTLIEAIRASLDRDE